MYSPTSSLTDPPAESPIAEGLMWVQGVALGSTATAIAVIAIAVVGLLMLSGRLELRRGITVVLGCFILFGASGIAAAITGLATTRSKSGTPILPSTDQPEHLSAAAPAPSAYDPYAGASVPSSR